MAILRVLSFLSLIWLGSACDKEKKSEEESNSNIPVLQVYAAASLLDVLQEMAPLFESKYQSKLDFNFAGSQILARQITHSLGADIFISANPYWIDEVELLGRMVEGTRKEVISNSLTMVASAASEQNVFSGVEKLCQANFEALVLADPNYVPAGKYAKAWLEAVDCKEASAWELWKDKLVPTQDVRQVVNLVKEKQGAVGVVYGSDVLASEGLKILIQPDAQNYPAISYVAAAIKKNDIVSSASHFLDFLQSDEARALFLKHGFRSPKNNTQS